MFFKQKLSLPNWAGPRRQPSPARRPPRFRARDDSRRRTPPSPARLRPAAALPRPSSTHRLPLKYRPPLSARATEPLLHLAPPPPLHLAAAPSLRPRRRPQTPPGSPPSRHRRSRRTAASNRRPTAGFPRFGNKPSPVCPVFFLVSVYLFRLI